MSATATATHSVTWSAPAPLWDELIDAPADFVRPVLLRLEGDRFMDDLMALLATGPSGVVDLRARPASYRVRPPGHDEDWEPPGAGPEALKLFGAAHGHYNLVAASLVCQVPGLPERRVSPGDGDKVTFVVRRVEGGDERAWLAPAGQSPRWATLEDPDDLAAGEQELPLFAIAYADEGGLPRKLHAGLIPTATLDSWEPPAGAPEVAVGLDAARARWSGERDRIRDAYAALSDVTLNAAAEPEQRANMRDAVDLFLLDLADVISRWLPDAWAAIAGGPPALPAAAGARSLVARLRATRVDGPRSLAEVLADAWRRRDALLGETADGTAHTLGLSLAGAGVIPGGAPTLAAWMDAAGPAVDQPPPPPAGGPGTSASHAGRRPKLDPAGGDLLRIRCVYRRAACALVHGPVVSAATDDFRLAPFFDPDAPARPVHIALPFKTGVKDLRKLRKAVNVSLSDQLQRQMSRVAGLKGDRVQTQSSNGVDFGLVCSFSIPIITICALMVLMIFVALLNIVFFWMPLLRICLPVPKRGSA